MLPYPAEVRTRLSAKRHAARVTKRVSYGHEDTTAAVVAGK